uniref:Olfactory receptor, family 70, subfamily B, member 1 n=1 Tax=Cynoglossus semilaevis TaxID=244447 RepID=A0A3P8X567_CYNSE
MENFTLNSFTLQLEGLTVTEVSVYPVFFFFFLSYLVIIVMNVGIVFLVLFDKNLHQPMYLLFCNLPINDLIGNSIMCVVQAFTTHMFGTTSHTVLMTMAFDRLNRCRTLIMNPYCDNASLFKLSCESVFINNVYGLTFTVVLFTASIGSMVLTYAKIIVVCLTSRNKSLNSKALKTCSTHLVLYLMMLISGFIVIILHRFPQFSFYRKLSAILFHIIPGSLNPVIYGVQSAEIRKFVSKLFQKRKSSL